MHLTNWYIKNHFLVGTMSNGEMYIGRIEDIEEEDDNYLICTEHGCFLCLKIDQKQQAGKIQSFLY